jgi:hypothetical protein
MNDSLYPTAIEAGEAEDGQFAPDAFDQFGPFARILEPGVTTTPFALLVEPERAQAAARRIQELDLPRRALYLFGKKGITSSPEISRLDHDVELDPESEDEEEEEFA